MDQSENTNMSPNDNQSQPQSPPNPPQPTIQPLEQPQVQSMPMQAPQPILTSPQPMGTGAPVAKGSSHKLLFIIIGTVVGVLILAIVVVVVIVALVTVSKADYRKAYGDAQNLTDAYNKFSGVTPLSSSSTSTELSNDASTLKQAQASFSSAYNALKSDKAIMMDNEAKTDFNKITAKKDKIDEALTTEEEALTALGPIVVSVYSSESNISSPASAKQVLVDADQKLKALSLSQPANKQYVSDLTTALDKLLGVIDKVIAGEQDFTQYDSAANDTFYSAIDDLDKADQSWHSNIDKLTTDADATTQLNDLSFLLLRKAN